MRIGIDLGGTKIEAIALTDDGKIATRRRVATPTGNYGKMVRAVVDLVMGIEGELQMRGRIGIGTPGAVSPATGLIKNSNSIILIGRPLDKDLRRPSDGRFASATTPIASHSPRPWTAPPPVPRWSSA
jgi:fructokinase